MIIVCIHQDTTGLNNIFLITSGVFPNISKPFFQASLRFVTDLALPCIISSFNRKRGFRKLQRQLILLVSPASTKRMITHPSIRAGNF